jgi:hypothetical protein
MNDHKWGWRVDICTHCWSCLVFLVLFLMSQQPPARIAPCTRSLLTHSPTQSLLMVLMNTTPPLFLPLSHGICGSQATATATQQPTSWHKCAQPVYCSLSTPQTLFLDFSQFFFVNSSSSVLYDPFIFDKVVPHSAHFCWAHSVVLPPPKQQTSFTSFGVWSQKELFLGRGCF